LFDEKKKSKKSKKNTSRPRFTRLCDGPGRAQSRGARLHAVSSSGSEQGGLRDEAAGGREEEGEEIEEE